MWYLCNYECVQERPEFCYLGANFYNITNLAITSINHSLALTLKPVGIRVNTVISTMMDASFAEKIRKPSRGIQAGHVLIKHPLTVEEKADLILLLCSPKYTLRSGQTVFVDKSAEGNVSENVVPL